MNIKDFSWHYWDNVRYMSAEGLKEHPLAPVDKSVECGGRVCRYSEELILHVDRPTLVSWIGSDVKLRVTSSKVEGNVDAEVDEEKTRDFLNAMDKVASYLRKKNGAKTTGGVTTK